MKKQYSPFTIIFRTFNYNVFHSFLLINVHIFLSDVYVFVLFLFSSSFKVLLMVDKQRNGELPPLTGMECGSAFPCLLISSHKLVYVSLFSILYLLTNWLFYDTEAENYNNYFLNCFVEYQLD